MAYAIDGNGHLDLSPCFKGFNCDNNLAASIAREYYEAELMNLTAWDGRKVTNMRYDSTWQHIVSKHKTAKGPFNPVTNLDLKRVVRLPILKSTVEGRLHAEVYLQEKKGKFDKVQVLVSGADKDYVVVLGVVKDNYILRTAYPGDAKYTRKVRERGTLLECIGS